MRPAPDRAAPPPAGNAMEPAQVIARRLAAAGLAVNSTQQQPGHELIILNITPARSCLTLTGDGYSQWHYEPGTVTETRPPSPGSSPTS